MSGDHNQYQKGKSYVDDFECPRCGHCCQVDEGCTNKEAELFESKGLRWHIKPDGDDLRVCFDYSGKPEDKYIRFVRAGQQEPIAWMHTTGTGHVYFRKKPQDKVFNPQPVYTVPPRREWVGLTGKEWYEATGIPRNATLPMHMLKGIEKALKEKNG